MVTMSSGSSEGSQSGICRNATRPCATLGEDDGHTGSEIIVCSPVRMLIRIVRLTGPTSTTAVTHIGSMAMSTTSAFS